MTKVIGRLILGLCIWLSLCISHILMNRFFVGLNLESHKATFIDKDHTGNDFIYSRNFVIIDYH